MTHRLAGATESPISGPFAVSGYVALSRLPSCGHTLDRRTSLLAARLAAELSGCGWCIGRCRHDCRKAGISGDGALTDSERAALAFVETVTRSEAGAGPLDERVLDRARSFFADTELAELTAIAAEHHCLDSANFNHSGT
jgi:alkylhydroperoxidase family enzyme